MVRSGLMDERPRFLGAKSVRVGMPDSDARRLRGEIQIAATAWTVARARLRSRGWKSGAEGVEIILVADRTDYTARFWDDDRLFIHVEKLAMHGRSRLDGLSATAVIVHELGHRVWFQCLNEANRHAWARHWKELKRGGRVHGSTSGRFVSTYAKTDPMEDFAECFRAIILEERMSAENRARISLLEGMACRLRGPTRYASQARSRSAAR